MQRKVARVVITQVKTASTLQGTLPRDKEMQAFRLSLGPLAEIIPDSVIAPVFHECYAILFDQDYAALDGKLLYNRLSAILLSKNTWTWHLDELVRKVLEFFSRMPELTRHENTELQQELINKFILVLGSEGSPAIARHLAELLLKAYETSGHQIVISDLIKRIHTNPALQAVGKNPLERCVEEFVSILVRKGYLSFTED